MNEFDIDNTYLDDNFFYIMNSVEDEKLIAIVNYILENYEEDFSHLKISNFAKIINALFGNEIDANHLYRQIKYLINKGIYNRLLKKFKNDLISLGLNEDKTDLMVELIKGYSENINEINKKKDLQGKSLVVKDFDVVTEMPICTTNYELTNAISGINENIKKQNLFVKFNLQSNGNNGSSENKNLIVGMDKHQLINIYEEVEKIQEKLDKLY